MAGAALASAEAATVTVAADYLCAGANRYTAAADWWAGDENGDGEGLVAYGANTSIALWRPDATSRLGGVCRFVAGHEGPVKAVKFLGGGYLVSGGEDHAVKVWRVSGGGGDNQSPVECSCVASIKAHEGAVNCVATLAAAAAPAPAETSTRVFATGAADGTVNIWSFDSEKGKLRVAQSLRPRPKLIPLTVAMSRLGEGGEEGPIVLAVAGTRAVVQIYVDAQGSNGSNGNAEEENTCRLELQASLSGHEGWIRSLDFARQGRGLLLASASQDKYVRLWRLHRGTELPSAVAARGDADPTLGAYLPGRSPSNKAYRLRASGAGGGETTPWSVTFEALLLGHDDWIYSAKWYSSRQDGGDDQLLLLSASADNTLAVWEADPSSGIWVTTARLGEISREKGATTATGSTGGFWTGLWGPGAWSVACLGRTGSWRVWGRRAEGEWVPRLGLSGHTAAVTGVAWSRDGGNYLLSTSVDQTTRLHAEWEREHDASGDGGKKEEKTTALRTWHEMARPQIHGYDLNCIDTLGRDGTRFVSGADEKLMRVFDEPRTTAKLLRSLGLGGGDAQNGLRDHEDDRRRPEAADMPVLGLSNKAVDDDGDSSINNNNNNNEGVDGPTAGEGDYQVVASTAAAAAQDPRPPLEDVLARQTLWPEADKLYGHGYELSCLACSGDGRLVASACKASSANHAVIRLFSPFPSSASSAPSAGSLDPAAAAASWVECQRPPLRAHTLTATRLRFSADDRWLLSVGRDRTWAVFKRDAEEGQQLGLTLSAFQVNPKGHSRMILDAAWAPVGSAVKSAAEAAVVVAPPPFATAGRDKTVKIWRQQQQQQQASADGEGEGDKSAAAAISCVTTIPESHPVTAIDFLPRGQEEGEGEAAFLVLAVGTEAGKITLYTLDAATLAVAGSTVVPEDLRLPKAVLQLAWRPNHPDRPRQHRQLAVAGDDGSLRVYSFAGLLLPSSS